MSQLVNPRLVIPAKAGIQSRALARPGRVFFEADWIPAFAGMTSGGED
jgi:hypothetical protein